MKVSQALLNASRRALTIPQYRLYSSIAERRRNNPQGKDKIVPSQQEFIEVFSTEEELPGEAKVEPCPPRQSVSLGSPTRPHLPLLLEEMYAK